MHTIYYKSRPNTIYAHFYCVHFRSHFLSQQIILYSSTKGTTMLKVTKKTFNVLMSEEAVLGLASLSLIEGFKCFTVDHIWSESMVHVHFAGSSEGDPCRRRLSDPPPSLPAPA